MSVIVQLSVNHVMEEVLLLAVSDAFLTHFETILGPFYWRTLTLKDKDNYRLSAANLKPAGWTDAIVF